MTATCFLTRSDFLPLDKTRETRAFTPITDYNGLIAHLYDLVLLLGRLIEILVHLVEQPQEELLGVVLQIAAVLTAVLVDDALERGAHLRIVLAAPDGLEQQGELLGDLAPGAVLLRVELVAARQIDLVLIQDEVLGEDVRVREALQHRVHEARVAVIT